MFSGIVEETGQVNRITLDSLSITAETVLSDLKPGDSVAVNGICLTVKNIKDKTFDVDVMPETLRRTNLGELKNGWAVNLERALTFSGRIGGHLVQGHIDAAGEIQSLDQEKDAVLLTIGAPPEIMRYVVNKGFIAVDGLSLTVFNVSDTSFTVSLVTYSQSHTTIGQKKIGDRVNLEADIIAKYVERFIIGRQESRITAGFLSEHGFTS